VVDLVERLRNIESADARCTALTDNIINDTANCANCKTSANALFENELIIGRTEERLKAVQNAMFKGFRLH